MTYKELIIIMTILFSIVILFTCIGSLIKRKYSFFFENAVVYISYSIFLILQYKFKFYINLLVIFLVLITIIGNNLVGDYLNVYNRSKYYDRLLHAFGSFSFSLFFYSILDKFTMHPVYPRLYTSIFVVTIGISLGCIFEVFEFILDATINSNNQHGLKDTNFDIISNIIGSTIAGIVSNSLFF